MQTEKVKSNIGLALPASVVFVGDSDEPFSIALAV
jgi:hypothetical protein